MVVLVHMTCLEKLVPYDKFHLTNPSRTKTTVAILEYLNSYQRIVASPAIVVSAPICFGDSATPPSSSIHIHLYGCLYGGMGWGGPLDSERTVHCPRVLVTRGQQTTLNIVGNYF